MLVITELAEATEEVRNKKPEVYFNTPTGVVTGQDLGGSWNLSVGDVPQKPEGEVIEIADAVIRVGDLAGSEDMDLQQRINEEKFMWVIPEGKLTAHFEMVQILCDPTYTLTDALAKFCSYAFAYCEQNEMDLEKAIAAKIAYNKTRSHRHGGKAF